MIQIQPADYYSYSQGAKILMFGPPKRGKTRLLNTLSNAVVIGTDIGFRSMRGSGLMAWQASTVKEVEDFFAWYKDSQEARQYPNIAVDDVTALSLIYLNEGSEQKSAGGKKRHGQELYGHMATEVLKYMRFLKHRPGCNVVVLCKEMSDGPRKRPSLPGNVLSVEIPHLFDEILYLDKVPVQGGGEQLCFNTKESLSIAAGTRTLLDHYEPANLDYIINKILTT